MPDSERNKLKGRVAEISKTIVKVLDERKNGPFPATNVDLLRAEVSSRLGGAKLNPTSFYVLLFGLERKGKVMRQRRGLYAAVSDETTERQ